MKKAKLLSWFTRFFSYTTPYRWRELTPLSLASLTGNQAFIVVAFTAHEEHAIIQFISDYQSEQYYAREEKCYLLTGVSFILLEKGSVYVYEGALVFTEIDTTKPSQHLLGY